MISPRVSFVFIMAILSPFADATTEETLGVKIFNRDYKISDNQMLAILKKADLESHGYKKEVTTKLVSNSGSDKPLFQKSYLYYKIVECSRLREIDQELQTLLPGVFGMELVTKINTEIKTKNLTSMKRCKVGLEVHFHRAEGCRDNKNKNRRRKRGCWSSFCFFCWDAQLSR